MRSTVRFASRALLLALLAMTGNALAAQFDGKRVLFIDSYHQGYAWSDGIESAVTKTLHGSGAELKVVRMNTKRKKTPEEITAAADEVRAVIAGFKPDVVIAADDNASKYVIQPHFKDAKLPFVFCGVNWDASVYGYPYSNVTGMVEVAGARELVDLLSQFAKGSRVGLLADDTLSSRKDAENYRTKLGLNIMPAFVSSMDEWKRKYAEMQSQVDILIVGNIVGIADFDESAAKAHSLAVAKIPSGSVQIEPMPFAMIGYLKVAEEQGTWAANAAMEILAGASPSSIPVTRNKEGQVVINAPMVEAVGVELPYSLVESASSVIE